MVFLAGAVLIGYMVFLIMANYASQMELRQTAGDQFLDEEQSRAGVLSRFFAEKKTQIGDLANSREISIYFENKALGMTMAYGLRASLIGMENRFRQIMAGRRLGDAPLYKGIAFVDAQGTAIAAVGELEDMKGRDDWTRLTDPNDPAPQVLVEKEDVLQGAIISASCRFKEAYVGQAVALIDMASVRRHFLGPRDGPVQRRLLVDEGRAGDRSVSDGASASGVLRDESALQAKRTQESILCKVPVEGTPFTLASSIPASRVYGQTDPKGLLLATGVLGLFILGMAVHFVFANTRNQVLNARLEESSARESEIREKNLALEQEIERRREVVEALEKSEERYRSLIENIPDVVFSLDGAGIVRHLSNASSLYGYSDRDFLGESFLRFIHPEDRERVIASVREAVQTQRAYTTALQFRVALKDGTVRWMEANTHTRYDAFGQVESDEGVLRDITDRKDAEAQLQQYRENLEQMVEERTAQLKEAQKALRVKDMEAGRSQMAAVVLHNIGNAITPAKVHVESMGEVESEQIVRYLQNCYEELKGHRDDLTRYISLDSRGKEVFAYMETLIQGLGDQNARRLDVLHKIQSALSYVSEILTLEQSYGSNALQIKETLELNCLVEDALSMQAGSIEDRKIQVTKDLWPEAMWVRLDKSRLMQTLVNLIRNSCEAIDQLDDPSLPRQIQVKTFEEDGKAGFEIMDTGIGIEGDTSAFFEFGKSLKGSSGFGLTYCKEFVEANNGHILLSSPGTGKGTTVRMEFPLGPTSNVQGPTSNENNPMTTE
jgi:PAS domain S-box-containing protein